MTERETESETEIPVCYSLGIYLYIYLLPRENSKIYFRVTYVVYTQVPPPVQVEIPVCYSLGINEKKFPHGSYVRLRFFEGAPGTPNGWLLGCVFINKQV